MALGTLLACDLDTPRDILEGRIGATDAGVDRAPAAGVEEVRHEDKPLEGGVALSPV